MAEWLRGQERFYQNLLVFVKGLPRDKLGEKSNSHTCEHVCTVSIFDRGSCEHGSSERIPQRGEKIQDLICVVDWQ